MVSLTMPHAQVEPVTVLGIPLQFALPVTLAAMLITAVVIVFCVAVHGADSAHRAEIIRAFAPVIRAVGDAVKKVLDATQKLVEAIRKLLDNYFPPGAM